MLFIPQHFVISSISKSILAAVQMGLKVAA